MKSNSLLPEELHFSLENYFKYVKLTDIPNPAVSLDALRKIITHHNLSFPYHNTRLINARNLPISDRKLPSLDKNFLFEDMIKNHGGYCFQHLELLHAVLSELGFTIERYVSKPIMQLCSKMVTNDNEEIKTHEFLMIDLNGTKYMVDSGMCDLSLREPLEFKEGIQVIANDEYRLTKGENNRWSLDTKRATKEKWFCIHQFFNSTVTYEDIIRYHSDLYLTPGFRLIRDDLYLTGITTSEKRKKVNWFFSPDNSKRCIYSSIKTDGTEKKKELTSFDEAQELSKRKFGIS